MSINKTPILLFFIAFSLLINTQESSKDCDCTKIENNEKNDLKVVALAESIENSFHSESTEAFNDMFNIDCFTNRITDNELVETDSEFAKGFIQGVKGAVNTLSTRILREIQMDPITISSVMNTISLKRPIILLSDCIQKKQV
ncbi:hypothetical protein [Winogradskyella sp. A2]|uniref:hypothetical protein n=1 Tax=Winogradskyella sp. A2 TaxID=3366944 RepID=UPI00398C6174